MGFISENMNSFEVYLTDLGKQKFFDGGFKDSIAYFSLSDCDNDYKVFMPDIETIPLFLQSNIYTVDSFVKFSDNGKYYRLVVPYVGITPLPTNNTYWNQVYVFNPTVIADQPIPTIDHVNLSTSRKTSLANGLPSSDDYSSEVFTQVPLRGKTADNMQYKNGLLGIKSEAIKELLMFEPDLNSNDTISILIYTDI